MQSGGFLLLYCDETIQAEISRTGIHSHDITTDLIFTLYSIFFIVLVKKRKVEYDPDWSR